jgi:hypothetical protein
MICKKNYRDSIIEAGDRDINVKLKLPLIENNIREEIYSKKLDKWVLALPIKDKLLQV